MIRSVEGACLTGSINADMVVFSCWGSRAFDKCSVTPAGVFCLQKDKKVKAFPIVVLLLFGAFLFVANSYRDAFPHVEGAPQRLSRQAIATPRPARPEGSRTHQVVYKITTGDYGSQDIDVTYEMPSGTAQKTVCICRHAKTAVVDTRTAMSGDFVYLSAQNDETNSPILCEIYIDGLLTYQVKSFGPHKIASCSGTVP